MRPDDDIGRDRPSDDPAPRSRRRISTAALAAVGTGGIPLVCAVLVVAISSVRIGEADRAARAGAARVAATWIADRLAVISVENRPAFLARVGEDLGAMVGLFDTGGEPLVESPLARLPGGDLRRVLTGEISEVEVDGEDHGIAAATMRPPLGRMNAVVAIPEGFVTSGLNLSSVGALAACALAILLVSALYGWIAVSDFRGEISSLKRWLGSAAKEGERVRDFPVDCPARAELGPLADSAARLRGRLDAEIALFLDARDEVEILDGRRTGFLTSVSQELHGSLEEVVAVADGLLEEEWGPLSEAQKDDVRIVKQASERLLNLVGEVIDLTSLISGRDEREPESVDLEEVAEEVVGAIRPQAERKRLVVRVEAEEGGPFRVRGVRQRLWQILTNLMSNAIKFTDEGEVVVRLGREPGGRIKIVVQDTGVGISKAEQRSIFDTFRQLGAPSVHRKGTGLGLAIAKRLVRLHGGVIRVSSVVGEGTRFTVLLPGEGEQR